MKSFVLAMAVCLFAGFNANAQWGWFASTRTLDLNQILRSNQPNQEKAEKLSLVAEELAFGPGIPYALRVAEHALTIDSQNVRARFLKASLQPMQLIQGFVTRTAPLNPYIAFINKLDYFNYRRNLNSLPQGPFRDFVNTDGAKIQNEQDITTFSRQLQSSLRQLRADLESLSSQNLTINYYTYQPGVSFQRVLKACEVKEVRTNVFSVPKCNLLIRNTAKLTYGDWESMKFLVAAYQFALTSWTAYNIDGLLSFIKFEHEHKHLTSRQVIAEIRRHPNAGRLEDVGVLREILTAGAETEEALKYAVAHKSELCPKGEVTSNNRPGFLISEGICATKSTLDAIRILDTAVRQPVGVTMTYYVPEIHHERWNGGEYTWWGSKPKEAFTYMDFTKTLNGSATNLQALLPNRFDKCGNPTGVPDETMAGLYVRGDFTKLYRHGNPDFLKAACR